MDAPKSKPPTEADLERLPSMTTLQAGLSGAVPAFPRKHKMKINKNTYPLLSDSEEAEHHEERYDEIADLESVPSLTTLQAELSGVHANSFGRGKGFQPFDVSDSKLDALKHNADHRSKVLPHKGETDDLERELSLTTLRAELSDVHAKSFRGTDEELNPRRSRLENLKQNTDHRNAHLPSHLQPHEMADIGVSFSSDDDSRMDELVRNADQQLGSNPPGGDERERNPSITTLRAELSDVHAKSFRGNEFNPRKSKLENLKQNTDHRRAHLPSHLSPPRPRAPEKVLSLLSDD